MVDEYQDVSRVQEEIVRAVSGGGRRLFMVGDVKQSIYRFRLADPTIFLEKYERFADAPAPDGEPRRVFLRESFRSRPEIVAAVNSVFTCLMSRGLGELDYDENARLIAALPYTGSVPAPELVVLASPGADEDAERPDKVAAEARYAAGRMRALVEDGTMLTAPGGERPMNYGDIAVLLRSANVTGGIWRRELTRMGIPVEAGQSGGFFESPEIEVMLSLLSIIDNPRQDVQLVSVLRSALFGFDTRRADGHTSRPDRTASSGTRSASAPRGRKVPRFRGDHRLPARLRPGGRADRADSRALPPARLLRGLRRAAATGRRSTRGCSGSSSWRGSLSPARGAASGASTSGWMKCAKTGASPPCPAGESSGRVRIMSIHQSKGLEFAVVFLGDTARRFNEMDLRPTVLVHPELGLGPKVTDSARGMEYPTLARRAVAHRLRREQLSEELRLLYVAMTRARERLIMTCTLPDPEKSVAQALRCRLSRPWTPRLCWICAASQSGSYRRRWPTRGTPSTLNGFAGCGRLRVPGAAQSAEEEPAAETAAPQPREPGGALLPGATRTPRAVALPSKVTATELKSLPEPDPESAELMPAPSRPFRMPDLAGVERSLTAAERGTATHLALRYIDLAPDICRARTRARPWTPSC